VLGALVLGVWQADWSVPFFYSKGDDGLFLTAYVKVLAETGWDFHSENLGRPFGAELYEFPVPNAIHFLIVRLLLFVIPNVGAALNVWILLQIPLAAVTAYAVFSRLRLSRSASIVVAILFALLPYRFLRYEIYFLVPLAILVAFWIAEGKRFLHSSPVAGRRRPMLMKRMVVAAVICISIACDNQYYALFALLIFVAAAVQSVIVKRNGIAGLLPTVLLCGVIVSGVGLNILPSFVYEKQHPEAYESYIRSPYESELYGLTIAQLVLPVPHHRLDELAQARRYYDKQFPLLVNENTSASLGLAATAGFAILIGIALAWNRRSSPSKPPLAIAASLNLTCVLLGTVGGVGALFSYYVTDLIRAWNRIDPFIAFLCLLAFGALLDWLRRRYVPEPSRRPLAYATLALVLVAATLEQTSAGNVPPYARDASLFRTHRQFVERVARTVPANAEIYELPYVHFPEGPPVLGLGQYDELFPFLHSTTLRWSFGAPSSTGSGQWQAELARVPDGDLAWRLAAAGFSGIVVMRAGYADRGAAVETLVRKATGSSAIVSNDGAWAFYDLSPIVARMRSVPDGAAGQADVLNPVIARFGPGCFYAESLGEEHWRWCRHDGSLEFDNPMAVARHEIVRFRIETGERAPAATTLGGLVHNTSLDVTETGADYAADIAIPPGHSALQIHSNAEPLTEPSGAKLRVFRLVNVTVSDMELATFAKAIGVSTGASTRVY